MNIQEFYDSEASEEWFTKKRAGESIHDYLIEKGFYIQDISIITAAGIDLDVPVEVLELSWGKTIGHLLGNDNSAFLMQHPYELKKLQYEGSLISELVTSWLSEMAVGKLTLLSLDPSSFLYANTANKIDFEDIFRIVKGWKLDCMFGIYDENKDVRIVFDAEFEIVYFSFSSAFTPSGFDKFSSHFNKEFKEKFVRDAKLRTGADPDRAAEYFEKLCQAFLK
ncbi:MAG: hypothetical protein KTR35_08040 [Gammaproteobacteria bacterium]|nr:hypothetical protein [Gammaproteobacteria bacterium]